MHTYIHVHTYTWSGAVYSSVVDYLPSMHKAVGLIPCSIYSFTEHLQKLTPVIKRQR